jgi:anaerobic magnesium-protoporphyrin IX monomethyl ester cyclase
LRVLLVAMPDTVSALDAIIRIPNLGLCSLAGNISKCEVKIIDLAFHNKGITCYLEGILESFKPDLVGLSAMSFQYASACRVARICREKFPSVPIAVGGYHATLLHDQIENGPDAKLFDFIIYGEGEITFRELINEMQADPPDFRKIAGLAYRTNGKFRCNPPRPLANPDAISLPNRSARIMDAAAFMGQPFDCAETSRGCTMGCRFCSIAHMYGRRLRNFKLERVIEDLKNLKVVGKKGVFFVDDNITLDVPRLKQLCRLIIQEELNSMAYVIQASVAGISSDPEVSILLSKAGFKWVFLGIENGLARNLDAMGKKGVIGNTRKAVSSLKKDGIGVFGGFIVGNPQDSAEDIRATYKFALDIGVDHPIMQCLTPYPGTESRAELLTKGLITNPDDYSLYNGFATNIRTERLTNEQLNMAILVNGLRLYFNPRYLLQSKFWKINPKNWPKLAANNFRYLSGARNGRIFTSNHRW